MPQNKFSNTPFESLKNLQPKAEDEAKREFDEVLKGRFTHIPTGSNFESELPGVKDMTIMKAPYSDEAALVVLFYGAKTKTGETVERSTTCTVNKDGQIIGKIPSELRGLAHGEVLKETLEHLKGIKLDKWFSMQIPGLEILPPGDWESYGSKGEGGIRERAPIDERRFGFFMDQPHLLAALEPGQLARINYGKAGRFGPGVKNASVSDYHAFIFPRGVIFENVVCENNIYFYAFDGGVSLSQDEVDKIKNGGVSEEERESFFGKIGLHVERQKAKQELRSEGKRYPHPHPAKDASPEVKQKFYDELQEFINQNLA